MSALDGEAAAAKPLRTHLNALQSERERQREVEKKQSRCAEESLALLLKTTTQPNADFSSIRTGERVARIRTRAASFEAFDRQHSVLAKSAYAKKDREERQTCTQRSTLQKRFDRRQIESDSRYLRVGKFAPNKYGGKKRNHLCRANARQGVDYSECSTRS